MNFGSILKLSQIIQNFAFLDFFLVLRDNSHWLWFYGTCHVTVLKLTSACETCCDVIEAL